MELVIIHRLRMAGGWGRWRLLGDRIVLGVTEGYQSLSVWG